MRSLIAVAVFSFALRAGAAEPPPVTFSADLSRRVLAAMREFLADQKGRGAEMMADIKKSFPDAEGPWAALRRPIGPGDIQALVDISLKYKEDLAPILKRHVSLADPHTAAQSLEGMGISREALLESVCPSLPESGAADPAAGKSAQMISAGDQLSSFAASSSGGDWDGRKSRGGGRQSAKAIPVDARHAARIYDLCQQWFNDRKFRRALAKTHF